MATPRPRPRPEFELRSTLSPDAIAQRVNAFLKTSQRLRGVALASRIELSMAGDELRFWSPQIVARVTADEAGGARLHARIGPDPYVWAMYVFAYGILVLLTVLACCFGVSQWLLKQPPTALYATPAAAVLAGLVYGVSFVGQGLSSDQMYLLRATLTSLVEAEDESIG